MKRPFPSLNLSLLFAATSLSTLIWCASRVAPIADHHNVQVLVQVDRNNWWMVDDEDPKGFLYTACDDFPNDKVIQSGYLAREARWEEQGQCKSIHGDGLGFWWNRDENFNVRRIEK